MNSQYLITPDLQQAPVHDDAEPADAGIEHDSPEDNE